MCKQGIKVDTRDVNAHVLLALGRFLQWYLPQTTLDALNLTCSQRYQSKQFHKCLENTDSKPSKNLIV